MATLPEVKKRIIIQKEPNTSAAKIIDIIKNFDNISLDDFPKMDSTKREFIQEELRKGPRPAEQNEWKEIERSRGNYDSNIDAAEAFLSQIGNYIRNWEGSRPEGNHVNEANSLYDEVESYIQQYNNGIEEKDWNNLDIDNNYALLEYLTKYPKTSHKKDIDDLYWSNVNKEIVSEIDEYTVMGYESYIQGTLDETRDIAPEESILSAVRNVNRMRHRQFFPITVFDSKSKRKKVYYK